MATTTTNYGLTKPDPADRVDITVLDADLDIIDAALAVGGGAAGGVFSVKSYGAQGDGSHDDTSAIQAAVTAAVAAGGGTVVLPAGQYLTSSTLRITGSNVSITGPGEILYHGASGSQAILATGSIGAAKALTAATTPGTSQVLTVSPSNAALLSPGDWLKIATDENYFVVSGRDYKKGELVRIAAAAVPTVDANGPVNITTGKITLDGPTEDETYTNNPVGIILSYSVTGYSPTVQVVTFIENIRISNLKVTGLGINNNQFGICYKYVKNGTITGCELSELVVGLEPSACLFLDIDNCYIHDINTQGTGYGVSVEAASQHVNIHDNKFYNCRVGVTTGGYDGVCMYLHVHENQIKGTDNAAINCHGNSRFAKIENNLIEHCVFGVNAMAPYTTISHNRIVSTTAGPINLDESAHVGAVIVDNYIETTVLDVATDAILVKRSASVYEACDYLIINNNIINWVGGGGIIVLAETTNTNLEVCGNSISNVGYDGIKLLEGRSILVSGNTLISSSRTNPGITVKCTTGTASPGSVARITDNLVYKFNSGLKITAADFAYVAGNVFKTTLTDATTYDITATAITLGSNYPSPNAALANTSGATVGQLETEVNALKALMRSQGLLAP